MTTSPNPYRFAASLSDEGRYRLLVDAITDYAIYLLDPEGRISSWNTGAERFKGYTADEVIGEHYSRFFTEEDRQNNAPMHNLRRAQREGRFEAEGWRVRKDGSRFWAHVVIDPIIDPDGELVGFAKITRDLTERKTAQEQLEQAREALAQSQKMEAIGQLTGGVAHDFNNLLTVILGSLELIKKRLPSDPAIKSLLDNALQAAARGASLTQRLLAFARRQDLDLKPVTLPDLVRGMAPLLERTLGPSIQIETRFPLFLPPVHTDANQLESALLNLAVNSRDAMSRGGTITITAQRQALDKSDGTLAPGSYVKLVFADSGEGMDEQTIARAMEPFFTTKGVGKGTGLGLSMVQGLVHQSGGKLEIESEVGKGTSVSLWLPTASVESPLELEEVEQLPPLPTPRLRILAVDDDALVLMNTASILEDMGHEVTQASSGNEALNIVRNGARFDVVITDYAMPKMTGAELAAALKAIEPELPLLLATGYAELPRNEQTSLPRLPKPFFRRDIEAALRELEISN